MGDVAQHSSDRTSLFEQGWRQGAVFRPSVRAMQALVNVKSVGEGEPVKQRTLKDSEYLLLITHDCDIAQKDYRHLEALICKKYDLSKRKDLAQIERIGPVNPRSFVVDKELGLVAETHYRIVFDKDLIDELDPPNFCISGEFDLRRLREWLAMRYARAANLDRTHNIVFGPLVSVFGTLEQTEPMTYRRIQEVVHQVRVRIPDEAADLLEVSLLIILRDLGDELKDDHLEGVVRLEELMRDHLVSSSSVSYLGSDRVLYEELLHIDVMRTKALSADRASYDENWDLTGATPLQLLETSPFPESV